MGKAPSRPTAGVASRRTRVLAAFALFLVLAMPLAGTWTDQNAGAQVIWDFWMESDMDLFGNDQTIRLFGNIGYAIADHPIVIQVFDERNNLVDLDQVQTDSSGGFEATVGPIRDDGSYTVHAKHEFAGSTWMTFTIGQPPEAVLEEAPEPVPETGDAPPETDDAVPTVEETVQHAPMTGWELFLLPVVLISLSVIISSWLLYRFLRSETQAEHEEAMPPGHDEPREPASGPDPETPQSGHRADSSPLSKFVEDVTPTQKRKPAVKAAALTASESREWDKARRGEREARISVAMARFKGKYMVFDTNICISYMCGRFAQDMEMGAKSREMFNGPKRGNMDPYMSDCIDIALDEGRICLPTKTIREFRNRIQELIDDKEIEWADRPKMEKSELLAILFGFQQKGTHNATIKKPRSNDLDAVKGMYDEFAADTSQRMVRNMDAMYAKLIRRANGDEIEIARIKKMREDKESPLGDGDAEILATALTLSAELKPLCLITMDRDMLNVARDIKDRIGIEIIGGSKR